ncbi:MAG: hypothetical protein IJL69_01385, partial [Oscillospiraceae bacterium]|nr:hypothetical protein [Oscillospiraceae bacterium]
MSTIKTRAWGSAAALLLAALVLLALLPALSGDVFAAGTATVNGVTYSYYYDSTTKEAQITKAVSASTGNPVSGSLT